MSASPIVALPHRPLGCGGAGCMSEVPRPGRAGRDEIPTHICTLHGSKESTMKTQLNLEALEARDTPSTITLEGSTIVIRGSSYNDTTYVTYDDRGTWWWVYDDQIRATLTNNVGEHLQFAASVFSVG